MRGAGPAGGLLFLAVLAFIGWLVATDLEGVTRVLLLAAVLAAGVGLAFNVARRR